MARSQNVESFAPVAKMLRKKNFSVRLLHGTTARSETQTLNGFFGTRIWEHVALCPGFVELLEEDSFC